MRYQYPTKDQIEQDGTAETTAITVAMTALLDVLDECPLADHFKVYALCELACKLCPVDYVDEVVNEIRVVQSIKEGKL